LGNLGWSRRGLLLGYVVWKEFAVRVTREGAGNGAVDHCSFKNNGKVGGGERDVFSDHCSGWEDPCMDHIDKDALRSKFLHSHSLHAAVFLAASAAFLDDTSSDALGRSAVPY
jgi:hypothetical protein